MQRKILYWKLRDRELQLGERTLVMGILNITPDSFSDGGRYIDPEKAYSKALELQAAGADIIDIGAESTRPGAEPVSADEEWRRLVPLLRRLRGNLSVPVSLDTYKSETAERALAYDVHILNDPSGLTFDPALAKVAASGNLGLILNHMRGRPEQWAKMGPLPDAIGTVTKELDAAVSRARHAGVDRQRIVVDPGIGFGKRKEQNSELIAQLGYLSKLDLPILVGASRKAFLAQGTEQETMFATAAAVAVAVMNGAHIVRVHDVKEMLAVVRIADELARSEERPVEVVEERPAARRAPAKMPAWEEEKPKPTRPPMKRLDPPIAVTLDRALETVAAPAPPVDTSDTVKPKKPTDDRDYPPAKNFDRAPRRDAPYAPANRPFEKSNDRPLRREERPAANPGRADRPLRKPFQKPGGDGSIKRNSGKPFGRSGDRPSGDRPVPWQQKSRPGDKPPQGNRPLSRNFGPPLEGRPSGDRHGDKPPQGNRPPSKNFNRPPEGQPSGDRRGDKPSQGNRPPSKNFGPPLEGRPSGDRHGDKPPQGNRPSSKNFGPPLKGRPSGDRPGRARPEGGRPQARGPLKPRKPFRRD